MRFQVHIGKLNLTAPRAVTFGRFDAANLVRGHFGKELFRERPELYQQLYDPAPMPKGPSGFADPPRPFRLITKALAGKSFQAGESIEFGIHLFDARLLPQLGASGFSNVEVDLEGQFPPTERLELEFVTPTEIRGLTEPEFGTIFARLRDRISLLRSFYGAGPLEIDFRAMGERAREIRLVSHDLEIERGSRKSTSQGTRHPLGGFLGSATYEGDLTEFLPFLAAGALTGVGKYTVWGQGEISTKLIGLNCV